MSSKEKKTESIVAEKDKLHVATLYPFSHHAPGSLHILGR